MALQLIGTDALADEAVSTDKSQPFGNIILDSSAAGTDVGDRILLDRTNANGQDAGDAINVEKEILDIEGINVASRKQLKLGAVILESGTTDTVDGDVLLLDSTASGVDEGEMVLYNETFIDKVGLFNINTLGSAGQALKVDTAGIAFEFGSVEAGGLVVQQITSAVAKATFTSAIPDDTSTPTVTEGTEIYSQAITPAADTNKIFITGAIMGTSAQANGWGITLFRGSTCILTVHDSNAEGGTQPDQCNINVLDDPGTTSETTYSIRAGCMAGSSATFIQRRGTEKYNNTMNLNCVTLQEIKGS